MFVPIYLDTADFKQGNSFAPSDPTFSYLAHTGVLPLLMVVGLVLLFVCIGPFRICGFGIRPSHSAYFGENQLILSSKLHS